MRAHDEGIESRRGGQLQSDGGRLAALLAGAIERVTYGAHVRSAACEGLGDGGVDVLRRVRVEQSRQVECRATDVAAALGDEAKQLAAVGYGLVHAVEGAVLSGLSLPRDELLDVGRLFNLAVSIEGARTGGNHLGAVEHPYLGGESHDEQRAADVGVRHGVVVEIEADIGGLPDLEFEGTFCRKPVARKRQERAPVVGEDLTDRATTAFGTRAVGRVALRSGERLGVEVVEIRTGPCRQEGVARVANGLLDIPFASWP